MPLESETMINLKIQYQKMQKESILKCWAWINFKVELTSKARKIAVADADVANFIILAVVNYEMVIVLDTPEELILNIDATQYQVGSTQEYCYNTSNTR